MWETNVLFETALRIIYWDKMSSFNELLGKNNSASFHQKNLQALPMEINL